MIYTKRLCTACGGDSSHQQLLIANEKLNPLANCFSGGRAALFCVPVTALMTGPDDTVANNTRGKAPAAFAEAGGSSRCKVFIFFWA